MRLLPALLLALTASATPACAQRATPKSATTVTKSKVKTSQKTAASTQAAPVIVFKKTPCFGPCPHYEATIYPDGRVSYMGRSNVKMMGAHELKLPAATVQKALADAQRLGFGQLNDHYTLKNVTDLPSIFLSVRQPDGQLKTVQVEGTAPAALQALLDYLSQEVDKVAGNTPPTTH